MWSLCPSYTYAYMLRPFFKAPGFTVVSWKLFSRECYCCCSWMLMSGWQLSYKEQEEVKKCLCETLLKAVKQWTRNGEQETQSCILVLCLKESEAYLPPLKIKLKCGLTWEFCYCQTKLKTVCILDPFEVQSHKPWALSRRGKMSSTLLQLVETKTG